MNASQHNAPRSIPSRALRLGAAAAVALLVSASGGYAQSFTEYPVPTAAANPTAITFGPDGNLWFTERDANKIAKINTAGVVTEFPTLPNNSQGQGSQPLIIVAAPDGALYFTMTNASRIGKITASRPLNNNFRWRAKEVWLWRSRVQKVSPSKANWPMKYTFFSHS